MFKNIPAVFQLFSGVSCFVRLTPDTWFVTRYRDARDFENDLSIHAGKSRTSTMIYLLKTSPVYILPGRLAAYDDARFIVSRPFF